MMLYHFTSRWHLQQILKDGYLKLTPSNLKEPYDLQIINGKAISSTDNIKPVVWLTTVEEFEKAANCGISGASVDKTEARIEIDTSKYPLQAFYKWDKWAIKNGTDIQWFELLKKTAPEWKTFYVSEHPIKILNSYPCISFRPDIFKELASDGSIVWDNTKRQSKG